MSYSNRKSDPSCFEYYYQKESAYDHFTVPDEGCHLIITPGYSSVCRNIHYQAWIHGYRILDISLTIMKMMNTEYRNQMIHFLKLADAA
jgi:hypothetical protein